METVAGEKPLLFATSRMVTAWPLPLCRFTGLGSSARMIILRSSTKMQCFYSAATASFGGHFKRELLAESARLPDAERNPGNHPDGTHNFRPVAQVPP